MELLRMRHCRAAEHLRARSNDLGILADRIAERRQQLHALKVQALMVRLRMGCGRSPPLQKRELALAVWRKHVAKEQQARKNLRRAALRFRASTLLAGMAGRVHWGGAALLSSAAHPRADRAARRGRAAAAAGDRWAPTGRTTQVTGAACGASRVSQRVAR